MPAENIKTIPVSIEAMFHPLAASEQLWALLKSPLFQAKSTYMHKHTAQYVFIYDPGFKKGEKKIVGELMPLNSYTFGFKSVIVIPGVVTVS